MSKLKSIPAFKTEAEERKSQRADPEKRPQRVSYPVSERSGNGDRQQSDSEEDPQHQRRDRGEMSGLIVIGVAGCVSGHQVEAAVTRRSWKSASAG